VSSKERKESPSSVSLAVNSQAALDYGYDPVTGNLASITRCDAPTGGGGCTGAVQGLALAYDGALPTTTTWSGSVAGSVTHGYDDDLRIASEQVNAAPAIVFQYDDDNLPTGAGALSLVPDHDAEGCGAEADPSALAG